MSDLMIDFYYSAVLQICVILSESMTMFTQNTAKNDTRLNNF